MPGARTNRVITLRASRLWTVVPAEIVLVRPRKQWSYAGHPYVSGEIVSSRLDVNALGLVPLGLVDEGMWDPSEECWGEDGEPIEEWMLMRLCDADPRCLDAHAHLGKFEFDHAPEKAIRHYEAGMRIGELSLPPGFDGVLPWGLIDNGPFLRCMSGLGLCLWRLDRFQETERIFERMLWLNPSDNQGVRFLIGEVRAGKPWKRDRDRRRSEAQF